MTLPPKASVLRSMGAHKGNSKLIFWATREHDTILLMIAAALLLAVVIRSDRRMGGHKRLPRVPVLCPFRADDLRGPPTQGATAASTATCGHAANDKAHAELDFAFEGHYSLCCKVTFFTSAGAAMELREALLQINAIHAQISRAETFRGYRAASVGSTALLAFAAAGLQTLNISDPVGNLTAYLQLWIGTAFASVSIVAVELAFHCARSPSQFAKRQTWQAIGQFLPCLVAGALLTWALSLHAPSHAALLPGLWAVVFSLGIFASARQLPREVIAVAIYYLLAGIASLAWFQGPRALSPWAMAGTFGVGQLLTAAILYWTLERRHG